MNVYDIKVKVYPDQFTEGPALVRDFVGIQADDEATAVLRVFLQLDDDGHKNVGLISCTPVVKGVTGGGR